MKKRPSPAELQALAAARRRSLLFVIAAVALSLLAIVLSSEFLALHCVMLAAVTLAAALSSAWAAIPIDPSVAPRAGMQAGMGTAMAFVLPFAMLALYHFAALDAATASRMAGEMNASQATNLALQNITPGLEYFRGEYVSYIFGYMLFGLVFGFGLGWLGGILARHTAR
ncbi:MAG: hypothetical protein M1434_04120 [Chloroflexi bacterium]|nr:hypothetical protein [Chloroflexota bacterium]MCL5273918.1 hypothetical protein [Chloroflexota bacterium]